MLPFDFSANRTSRAHSSQSTIQRISTDVRKYAEKTNKETIITLIGFTPVDIDSLKRPQSILLKAHSQLNSLVKSLNESMYFDRKSIGNEIHRAIAITTSDERSDKPYLGGVKGECKFLKFRLVQCSEQ